jgi:hypothetical protein
MIANRGVLSVITPGRLDCFERRTPYDPAPIQTPGHDANRR